MENTPKAPAAFASASKGDDKHIAAHAQQSEPEIKNQLPAGDAVAEAAAPVQLDSAKIDALRIKLEKEHNQVAPRAIAASIDVQSAPQVDITSFNLLEPIIQAFLIETAADRMLLSKHYRIRFPAAVLTEEVKQEIVGFVTSHNARNVEASHLTAYLQTSVLVYLDNCKLTGEHMVQVRYSDLGTYYDCEAADLVTSEAVSAHKSCVALFVSIDCDRLSKYTGAASQLVLKEIEANASLLVNLAIKQQEMAQFTVKWVPNKAGNFLKPFIAAQQMHGTANLFIALVSSDKALSASARNTDNHFSFNVSRDNNVKPGFYPGLSHITIMDTENASLVPHGTGSGKDMQPLDAIKQESGIAYCVCMKPENFAAHFESILYTLIPRNPFFNMYFYMVPVFWMYFRNANDAPLGGKRSLFASVCDSLVPEQIARLKNPYSVSPQVEQQKNVSSNDAVKHDKVKKVQPVKFVGEASKGADTGKHTYLSSSNRIVRDAFLLDICGIMEYANGNIYKYLKMICEKASGYYYHRRHLLDAPMLATGLNKRFWVFPAPNISSHKEGATYKRVCKITTFDLKIRNMAAKLLTRTYTQMVGIYQEINSAHIPTSVRPGFFHNQQRIFDESRMLIALDYLAHLLLAGKNFQQTISRVLFGHQNVENVANNHVGFDKKFINKLGFKHGNSFKGLQVVIFDSKVETTCTVQYETVIANSSIIKESTVKVYPGKAYIILPVHSILLTITPVEGAIFNVYTYFECQEYSQLDNRCTKDLDQVEVVNDVVDCVHGDIISLRTKLEAIGDSADSLNVVIAMAAYNDIVAQYTRLPVIALNLARVLQLQNCMDSDGLDKITYKSVLKSFETILESLMFCLFKVDKCKTGSAKMLEYKKFEESRSMAIKNFDILSNLLNALKALAIQRSDQLLSTLNDRCASFLSVSSKFKFAQSFSNFFTRVCCGNKEVTIATSFKDTSGAVTKGAIVLSGHTIANAFREAYESFFPALNAQLGTAACVSKHLGQISRSVDINHTNRTNADLTRFLNFCNIVADPSATNDVEYNKLLSVEENANIVQKLIDLAHKHKSLKGFVRDAYGHNYAKFSLQDNPRDYGHANNKALRDYNESQISKNMTIFENLVFADASKQLKSKEDKTALRSKLSVAFDDIENLLRDQQYHNRNVLLYLYFPKCSLIHPGIDAFDNVAPNSVTLKDQLKLLHDMKFRSLALELGFCAQARISHLLESLNEGALLYLRNMDIAHRLTGLQSPMPNSLLQEKLSNVENALSGKICSKCFHANVENSHLSCCEKASTSIWVCTTCKKVDEIANQKRREISKRNHQIYAKALSCCLHMFQRTQADEVSRDKKGRKVVEHSLLDGRQRQRLNIGINGKLSCYSLGPKHIVIVTEGSHGVRNA